MRLQNSGSGVIARDRIEKAALSGLVLVNWYDLMEILMLGLLGNATLLGYGGFLTRFHFLPYSRAAELLCLHRNCYFV